MLSNILSSPLTTFLKSVYGRVVRWAYNFDGIDDRATVQFRAINPDGDIRIKFRTGSTVPPAGQNYIIVSQMISSTFANREFLLQTNTANALQILVGGVFSSNSGVPIEPNSTYEVSLVGTVFTVVCNGVVQFTGTFNRGTTREPNAVTAVASRISNGVSAWGFFYLGPLFDIEINGILWPMGDHNQQIQLPSPSGLGPELITQPVLENPAFVGSQWTYLGGGRWQLISDGSYNGLTFITSGGQPEAGFVEFEIESISGGSIRCSEGTTGLIVNSQFNTPGRKRWYFIQKSPDNRFTFSRQAAGVPVTAVIKNISYKALWEASPTELVANGNFASGATGWSPLDCTLNASSGQAVITTTTGLNSRVERGVTLEQGERYLITADLISMSGNTSARLILIRGAAGNYAPIGSQVLASAGKFSFVVLAPATDSIISLRGDSNSAGTVTYDNVSVRKLTSLCNPLTLSNTTSDRWTEIEE